MQNNGHSFHSHCAHFVCWVFVVAYGVLSANTVSPALVQEDFFVKTHKELVSQDLKGINPDYLEAMAALETGRGTNELYKKNHNLFSIKASMAGVFTGINSYRVYASDCESIRDVVRLLSTRHRYARAYRLAVLDERKKFFQALQDSGYSESNKYAESLERVFQEFKRQEISERPNVVSSLADSSLDSPITCQ